MKSKYSAEEKFQIIMESFSENVTQVEGAVHLGR
jgi:transposase-like protein